MFKLIMSKTKNEIDEFKCCGFDNTIYNRLVTADDTDSFFPYFAQQQKQTNC